MPALFWLGHSLCTNVSSLFALKRMKVLVCVSEIKLSSQLLRIFFFI